MFGMILIILICSFLGMLIFAKYHDCDPVASGIVSSADQLLPLFVVDALRNYPTLSGIKKLFNKNFQRTYPNFVVGLLVAGLTCGSLR